MVFSLFKYLNSVIAITDGMFNFGNFLTKNAIAFHLTEIERQKRYLVDIKFCYATNTAIKNVKIERKALNFFPKIFLTKSSFFQKKYRVLYKKRIYVSGFWKFFPSFRLLIYLFRSNSKAMNQLFTTLC